MKNDMDQQLQNYTIVWVVLLISVSIINYLFIANLRGEVRDLRNEINYIVDDLRCVIENNCPNEGLSPELQDFLSS